VQALDDISRQLAVGITGEHHQAVVGHVVLLGLYLQIRWQVSGWGGRIRTFACWNQNPVP
jgi:hypothetical protein